jgi:beta-N-acetylhexosaminidase
MSRQLQPRLLVGATGLWRPLRSIALGAALLLSSAGVALGSPADGAAATAPPNTLSTSPTVAQLIGQKLVVAMSGTTPDADLLGRIERGEVGGVILFGSNITTAGGLAALTTELRDAAAAGGQPPLLIATDQEGGSVKRVGWAPPTLSPPAMGADGRASTAFAQGKATAVVLGCAGINANLAPVADVPSSTSSFLYRQGRTWSFDAKVTATMSDAFASGLEAGLGVPAMKHFPGIGLAAANTDSDVVTITASRAVLDPGLLPYRQAIANHIPIIMLSNATYAAYDGANGAGWSTAIGVGLLRDTLGFTGVTITDALNGAAAARGVTTTSLALLAALAGTDMILLTGSESSSRATFTSLLREAESGTIPLSTLQASYDRIVALKATITVAPPDMTPPTPEPPVSRLYAPATLGSATSPVRTTWSASDPCAISAYDLRRHGNPGSWLGQGLPGPRSTSIAEALTVGTTYRYAARATDGAGNVSGWTDGASFRVLRTQQSVRSITYRGMWYTVSNRYASGGSIAYSAAAGASVSFRLTGFSVSWVAYRGPDRGSAAVYIDGAYRTKVSLYATTYRSKQIVYAASWARNGTHTIRIVNLGTRGHSRVDVDAFVRLSAP